MKTVAVTGAAGFIGANIVRTLKNQGYQVRALVRNKNLPFSDSEIETRRCDLFDLDVTTLALHGVDTVFHCAAYGGGFHANYNDGPNILARNNLISSNVLEACSRAGVNKVAWVSSSGVYNHRDLLMDDTKPWDGEPHPSEKAFAWSKRFGELMAQEYYRAGRFGLVILRPSNPYGVYDEVSAEKAHVIPALIRRALNAKETLSIWGDGSPKRSFIYIDDLVTGAIQATKICSNGEAFNLGNSTSTSIRDVAMAVLKACGRQDVQLEFDLNKPNGHPGRFVSVKKAEELLGFRCDTTLDQGLARTVAWFKEHAL